jgi:plasmid maintenance system antidote protein VapI
MFNPPHPGEIAAGIIHGKAAISTEMAIRLEEALGNSAEI